MACRRFFATLKQVTYISPYMSPLYEEVACSELLGYQALVGAFFPKCYSRLSTRNTIITRTIGGAQDYDYYPLGSATVRNHYSKKSQPQLDFSSVNSFVPVYYCCIHYDWSVYEKRSYIIYCTSPVDQNTGYPK